MIKKWSIRYPAVGGEEERRAYVYLPTMYEADPDRRYPVLYMLDGQNVFFDEDATYGKSWGVADYLDYTDTSWRRWSATPVPTMSVWWSIRPTASTISSTATSTAKARTP